MAQTDGLRFIVDILENQFYLFSSAPTIYFDSDSLCGHALTPRSVQNEDIMV